MEIRVLYFAIVRERAGVSEDTIEVPVGATVAQAIESVLLRHPAIAPVLPHVRWALNEAFVVDRARLISPGDVLAVIPPVAGGAPAAAITREPIQARDVEALVAAPDRGGLVTFTGLVRDHTGEHRVTHLEYEAYVPMAEKVLASILDEAAEKWPGLRAAIRHRIGVLQIGEAAVVIAVSTPHRVEAFAACAFIIERLKHDAPIFKKEFRADGSVWVGMGP